MCTLTVSFQLYLLIFQQVLKVKYLKQWVHKQKIGVEIKTRNQQRKPNQQSSEQVIAEHPSVSTIVRFFLEL